jgi:hypothetical protein
MVGRHLVRPRRIAGWPPSTTPPCMPDISPVDADRRIALLRPWCPMSGASTSLPETRPRSTEGVLSRQTIGACPVPSPRRGPRRGPYVVLRLLNEREATAEHTERRMLGPSCNQSSDRDRRPSDSHLRQPCCNSWQVDMAERVLVTKPPLACRIPAHRTGYTLTILRKRPDGTMGQLAGREHARRWVNAHYRTHVRRPISSPSPLVQNAPSTTSDQNLC